MGKVPSQWQKDENLFQNLYPKHKTQLLTSHRFRSMRFQERKRNLQWSQRNSSLNPRLCLRWTTLHWISQLREVSILRLTKMKETKLLINPFSKIPYLLPSFSEKVSNQKKELLLRKLLGFLGMIWSEKGNTRKWLESCRNKMQRIKGRLQATFQLTDECHKMKGGVMCVLLL